jgi:hypothetical protein
MEAHYVSENLLHKMEEEVNKVAYIIAYLEQDEPDNLLFPYINKSNKEKYEQMECIHRTRRPELGMDWETYEMDKLNTEYKVIYEIMMEDPEYYYNETCKLFKN